MGVIPPDAASELPTRYLTRTTGPIIALVYLLITWVVSVISGTGNFEWDLMWRLFLVAGILWIFHISPIIWIVGFGGSILPFVIGFWLLLSGGYISWPLLAHGLYILSNLVWGAYLGMRETRIALWKDVQAYMTYNNLRTFSLHSWPAWMEYFNYLHFRRGRDNELGLLTDIEKMNILRSEFSIDVEHKMIHYDPRIQKLASYLNNGDQFPTRDDLINLVPDQGESLSQQHELGVRMLCQWFYNQLESIPPFFWFFDIRDIYFISRLGRGGKFAVIVRFASTLNLILASFCFFLSIPWFSSLLFEAQAGISIWFFTSLLLPFTYRMLATIIWQSTDPVRFYLCQYRDAIDKVFTPKFQADQTCRVGVLLVIAAEVAILTPLLGSLMGVRGINSKPLAFRGMIPKKSPLSSENTTEFLKKLDKNLPTFFPNYTLTFARGEFQRNAEEAQILGLLQSKAEKVRDIITGQIPAFTSKSKRQEVLNLKLEALGPSSFSLRFPRDTSLLNPSLGRVIFDHEQSFGGA